MKKLDIERMQRLEELVEKQERMIRFRDERLDKLIPENIKLKGANEALTDLIIRFKEGPIQITKTTDELDELFARALKNIERKTHMRLILDADGNAKLQE